MADYPPPQHPPRLIGLAGFKRSGKDTAAQALTDLQAPMTAWKKMAFADALKDAARAIFGFTDAQLYGDQKEVEDPFWGFTPRWALQRLGTEAVREGVGPDTWVKALLRRADAFWMFYPNVGIVIPDVRFPNEVKAIKERGGLLVLIDRPGVFGDGHESEMLPTEKHIFDVVISNSGSVAQLHTMMRQIVGVP